MGLLSRDFLSLAIDYGLHTYIETKLRNDASELLVRRTTARPLLTSACQPGPSWWLLKGAIRSDTVRLLLGQGSNPNEPFRGLTPWQHALHMAREYYVLPFHDRQEVATILRLMIQHGADLGARVKWAKKTGVTKYSWRKDRFDLSVEELIRKVFTRGDCSGRRGLVSFSVIAQLPNSPDGWTRGRKVTRIPDEVTA